MPPTLLLDDYLPTEVAIRIEDLAPNHQLGIGSGAIFAMRTWPRVRHRWHIETRDLHRDEIEKFRGFVNYVQGDTPFLFNGSALGDVQNKQLVGFGDGATVDFFLPKDRIINDSVTVYVNDSEEAGVTITNESGLITFTVAPANNAKIEAIYQCQFLCILESLGEAIAESSRENLDAYTGLCIVREWPNG